MAPPQRMVGSEGLRLRAAASKALKLYPGPVGALVSRELLVWDEFGYRLGGDSLIRMVVEDILKTPLPDASPVAGSPFRSAVGYGG